MDCRGVWLMILFQGMISTAVFAAKDESTSRSVQFLTRENKLFKGHVVKRFESPSLLSCDQRCLKNVWCTSTNYKASSKKDKKGTCELNKHEISLINDNTKFHEQEGVVFSMRLEGCLITGCLNGGSCLSDEEKQTFSSCSCKPPWTGERCEVKLAPECTSYTVNTEADRSVSFPKTSSYKCDQDTLVPGWYRFSGTAGSKMPTTCVAKYMCNTDATSWLNGTHPTLQEGVVSRKVCFHWNKNCCNWSVTINIRNCGFFYVYQLVKIPKCQLRYCVTK